MRGETTALDQYADSDLEDDEEFLPHWNEQPSRLENPQLDRMMRIIAKNRALQLDAGLEEGFSTQELMDALPTIIVECCSYIEKFEYELERDIDLNEMSYSGLREFNRRLEDLVPGHDWGRFIYRAMDRIAVKDEVEEVVREAEALKKKINGRYLRIQALALGRPVE